MEEIKPPPPPQPEPETTIKPQEPPAPAIVNGLNPAEPPTFIISDRLDNIESSVKLPTNSGVDLGAKGSAAGLSSQSPASAKAFPQVLYS